MCVDVSPAGVSGFYKHGAMELLQRAKEGIRSPITGVADDEELECRCWECETGSSGSALQLWATSSTPSHSETMASSTDCRVPS